MAIVFEIFFANKESPYYLTRWEGQITRDEFQQFIVEISNHWRDNHHGKKINVMIVDASNMHSIAHFDFKTFRDVVSAPTTRTDLVYVKAPETWKALCGFAKVVFGSNMIFCDTREEAIREAQRLADRGYSLN